jgi:hypothetical protein
MNETRASPSNRKRGEAQVSLDRRCRPIAGRLWDDPEILCRADLIGTGSWARTSDLRIHNPTL